MLTASVLGHVNVLGAMRWLPEDKSFILLAGDGYVGGTAFALILFPEPHAPESEKVADHKKHELKLAKTALSVKYFAAAVAMLLAIVWALGICRVFGMSSYHIFPGDPSLFAAIPLFGIADLFAALLALWLARRAGVVQQREVGDTTGQLVSVSLASVYLGFWFVTTVLSP